MWRHLEEQPLSVRYTRVHLLMSWIWKYVDVHHLMKATSEDIDMTDSDKFKNNTQNASGIFNVAFALLLTKQITGICILYTCSTIANYSLWIGCLDFFLEKNNNKQTNTNKKKYSQKPRTLTRITYRPYDNIDENYTQ